MPAPGAARTKQMFTVSHFQSDFSSGNYSEHNPRTPAGHEQVGKNRIYSSDLNHVTTDGRADAAPPKPDTIQCRSELRGFFSFSFHLSINFSFSVFAHDRNLHTMTQQVALLLCFRFCRPRCALTLHSVIYIHTYIQHKSPSESKTLVGIDTTGNARQFVVRGPQLGICPESTTRKSCLVLSA